MKQLILSTLLVLSSMSVLAQETKEERATEASFYMNADVVSRYLWRGMMYSSNVNIQPRAGITMGNFFVGAWGSYALSDKYAEVDFFAGFSKGNLTLMVNDYYAEIETDLAATDHFQWAEDKTPHALEATISYTLGSKFPLTLTAATFFYGNDKDMEGNNFYSTYIEGSYPFRFSGFDFSVFAGGTPAEGLYAQEAALVNLGITASKAMHVSEHFSLPVSMSLVSNPKAQDIFIIVKVTI